MNILSRKAEYINNPKQIFRKLFWSWLVKGSTRRVMLPWNIPIIIDPHQAIGKSIYTLGVYDLIVTEALNRLVQTGDHIIDVGANIGYMTNLMAYKCGNSGLTYSFEPHPQLINMYLKNNISILNVHGFTNIQFSPIALSDYIGTGSLFIPEYFDENNGIASLETANPLHNSVTVPVTTLDQVIPTETLIKVMKIDVEGHEFSVFKGADQLLSSGLIETIIYEEHEGITSQASTYLISKGYSIFKLTRSPRGVKLRQPADNRHDLAYEPINFLATINLTYVNSRFDSNGWTIYHSSSAAL